MKLDDILVIVSAGIMLPVTAMRLSSSGLRGFEHMLSENSGVLRSDALRARRICELVDFTAHKSPVATTCLARSLCKARLLRSRGYSASVRIGARIHGGAMDAHAWVEVDGASMGDASSSGFEVLRSTGGP